MFLLQQPTAQQVKQFLASQQAAPFTYSSVGATNVEPPSGFVIDHNRVSLGAGREVYERAVAALRNWEQFDLGWVKIVPDDISITAGAVVAIRARTFGIWTLSACRIVYLINEDGPVKKFGFAYGTLTDHVECGEERFTVEWHSNDDTVWYDILAFSRPQHFLVKLGRPVARLLQKQFASDSKQRMLAAVR